MSENSVNKEPVAKVPSPRRRWAIAKIIGLPAWVFTSFVLANLVVVGGLVLLKATNIYTPVATSAVFNAVVAAVIYLLTLSITIGVPWLLRRKATSQKELGLTRLPSWMDIMLAPAGAVVYLFFTGVLVTLFTLGFPQVDLQQAPRR